MSDLGAQMDRLIVLAQVAIPSIIAERGVRLSDDLRAEEFPHLFVFDPEETVELLDHHQERATASFAMLFVVRDESQESLLLKLEAFRDNISFDPTLNSLVDNAFVSAMAIEDHPADTKREGALVITTTVERF